MTVYFVNFKVRPYRNSQHFESVACAYCAYWVRCENKDDAISLATTDAEKKGWALDRVMGTASHGREYWLNKPDALKQFDKALKDGIAGVIDMFDLDDTARN